MAPAEDRAGNQELTATIRSEARRLGFGLFGVTPAEPLAGSEFYAQWVAAGYAGEMEYLKRNREKRGDPRLLVPGARSAICVGMHYSDSSPDGGDDPLVGRVSAYARGDDYHDVVKKRLAALWSFIEQAAPEQATGRYFVDTAPVLERELAQKAGLGWWGKNTCLINVNQGSYFFLGEIITDLPLACDQPAVDHCGTCTRCLDACPTDAFPQPYVLDATRCISYLTIELKGSIPEAQRAGLGNWVLGCDICQEVCPWNRRAVPSREPAFAARSGLQNPRLTELMALDVESFNQLFKKNPAKRPKRRGFLRNVAVALGNSGCAEARPALVAALRDEEPLVRGHAAWALARLGGDEARPALLAAAECERDEEVQRELDAALKELATREGGERSAST